MELYAVVEWGAKQYKVRAGDRIDVERIGEEPGKEVVLDKILLMSDGQTVKVGTPYLSGAEVICEVLSQIKDKKKITFQFRRRKSSKRKIGHRQKLTRLKVKTIKA